MPSRKPGARGPLKKLFSHPDKDEIFMDLARLHQQKVSGVGFGEERVTLVGLAEKYNISTVTLAKYEPEVQALMEKVRSAAAVVGITQLDVISEARSHRGRVLDLYQRAYEAGDLEMCFRILEHLEPITLDRLQAMVPSVESQGLTGAQRKQLEEARNGPASMLFNIVNPQGQLQEPKPVVALQQPDRE